MREAIETLVVDAQGRTEPGPSRHRSRTVDAWRATLLWTLGAALAAGALALCEFLANGRSPTAFTLRQPLMVAVKVFGLPHYLFAVGFLLSSARFRDSATRVRFGGLSLLGVALAVVFALLGGEAHPIVHVAFAVFFSWHVFRDEITFYVAYGECPQPGLHRRTLATLRQMYMVFLAGLTTPAFLYFLSTSDRLPMEAPLIDIFAPPGMPAWGLFPLYLLPTLALELWLARRVAKRYPGGWHAFGREHRPILLIYTGYTLIILSLAVLPSALLFFVLAHFVAWFRFGQRQLRDGGGLAGNPLRWVRTSKVGFRTVYLGLSVLVLGLCFVWTYLFPESTLLRALLSTASFQYLTIVHVTSSWATD